MLRKFNHSCAHHITSGGHLILLLVGLRLSTPGGWLFVLSTIGGISFVLWILNFRRARAVADTPTSRVASAPQGYVELHGIARQHPGHIVIAPLTSTPCVWFRYEVEEKRGKDWSVVQRGLSEQTFILDDGSGQALVDPDWAEVMTDHYRRWIEGKHRYTEWLLVPEETLYAIGEFATVGGSSTQLDARADLNALLADWKKTSPSSSGASIWTATVRSGRRSGSWRCVQRGARSAVATRRSVRSPASTSCARRARAGCSCFRISSPDASSDATAGGRAPSWSSPSARAPARCG